MVISIQVYLLHWHQVRDVVRSILLSGWPCISLRKILELPFQLCCVRTGLQLDIRVKLAPAPPLHTIGIGGLKFSQGKEVVDLKVCMRWKIFEDSAYRVRLAARLECLPQRR